MNRRIFELNNTRRTGVAVVVSAILAAACGGLPEQVESLEEARSAIRDTEQDRLAAEVAATELAAARNALDEADELYEDGADLELIEHQAYVAQRYADIADQRIQEAYAEEQIAQAEAERTQVLLEARSREVEVAQQQAQTAEQRAEALQQQVQAGQEENQALQDSLSRLEAQQTERGVVLTLADVLFDTGEATLQPGAEIALERLAGFMRDYPDRNLLIEGHTDAQGSEQFNEQLSEQRANAVRDALVARGIESARIDTVGLGEAYPLATNETVAGRQENRRVEIVISEGGGEFSQAAMDRQARN